MRYLAACFVCALASACAPPPERGWSGYVEGEYVYVAPAAGGTLSRLAVQRGQQVESGALLFALDPTAEHAAREEAQARWQAARAEVADAAKGRRTEEIAVAEAQLAQARAHARWAETELARQEQLLAQGFIAASRRDEAGVTAQQARGRAAELEAALRVARLPARSDARRAAEAQAAAASQAVVQSEWRQAQMLRNAPQGGRIAETYFRPGEWVPAGQPVLALLPPSGRKARFFVPEAEVGGLRLDQPVRLQCDGCERPIGARISFIADQAEYTPPVIYSNAQRARLVFLVEARPEAAQAERLHPGQPLDVYRTTGPTQ